MTSDEIVDRLCCMRVEGAEKIRAELASLRARAKEADRLESWQDWANAQSQFLVLCTQLNEWKERAEAAERKLAEQVTTPRRPTCGGAAADRIVRATLCLQVRGMDDLGAKSGSGSRSSGRADWSCKRPCGLRAPSMRPA